MAASKPECVTIFGALLPPRWVCLFLKEIMDDKLTAKVTTTGRTKNPLRFTFHQHLARAKIPYVSPPTQKWERKHRRKKIFSWQGPLIVNYEPYHGMKLKGGVPPIMSMQRKCLFEIILDYWHAAFQKLHCITINMCLHSCAVHRLN